MSPGDAPLHVSRSAAATGRVVVRCDAGPRLGIGHVMRCVALSEEFAARGFDVAFVADLADVAWARAQVEDRGFRHFPPPSTYAEEVAVVARLRPAFVVVDSYLLPEEVYVGMRGVAPTLALVDGDPAGRPADLWLDQNIGAEHDNWPVPDGTQRLAGLRYALMRSEVLDAREPAAHAESDPLRVLAFFGGTDAFGAGKVLVPALVATRRPFELRAVAPSPAVRAELESVLPSPGQLLEVVAPTTELSREVVAADVVVSAAGTSSWELLCLGAACAFVCVADNQAMSYGRVVGLGVAAGLGHLSSLRQSPAQAVRVLDELLDDGAERARLRAAGQALIDGRGRARVADTVLSRLSGA